MSPCAWGGAQACDNGGVTIIQNLGLVPYEPTMQAMQAFTEQRTDDTPDEIWVCQHPPVFTQGLAGKADLSAVSAAVRARLAAR